MANDIDGVVSLLGSVTSDVRDSFGGLTAEQLNWKPAPESWSIGQCLDHLIKSNEEFYPELDKLAAGTRKNTLWQSISPLSGVAGAFLVSTLKKEGNKVKTNQKMTPPLNHCLNRSVSRACWVSIPRFSRSSRFVVACLAS